MRRVPFSTGVPDQEAWRAPPFRAGKDGAPARAASRCQTNRPSGVRRGSDRPPGWGKVTPAERRAAQQGTRPRNPAVPAAQAAQSESSRLQTGEDINSDTASREAGVHATKEVGGGAACYPKTAAQASPRWKGGLGNAYLEPRSAISVPWLVAVCAFRPRADLQDQVLKAFDGARHPVAPRGEPA